MTERRSRKVQVVAAVGHLVHEVRLCQIAGGWQARIVTLPNQIWVDQDGTRALTFEAASPEEAERLATAAIERDCIAHGHRILDPSRATGAGDHGPARRVVVGFPMKFMIHGDGPRAAAPLVQSATTANLSETGLFIATPDVHPPGTRLSIHLMLPGLPGRLEGEVVWSRAHGTAASPAGMGVRLLEPSLAYRARLQSLG